MTMPRNVPCAKSISKLILLSAVFLLAAPACAAEPAIVVTIPGGTQQGGAEGVPFSAMFMAVSDPPGTPLTLSARNLPRGAVFQDNGDGTGTLDWRPDFSQSGAYSIDVTAAAGAGSGSAALKLDIQNVFDAPVFSTRLPETALSPGETASVTLTASDPEGDPIAFQLTDSTSYASGAAALTDNRDGTALISFSPSKAGYQYLVVTIADPQGYARSAPIAFRVGFPIQAARSGSWSDPNTWDLGMVPTASHRVLIEHQTVELDADAQAVEVIVGHHGGLTISRNVSTGLQLSGSMAVLHGGRLDAGTPQDPIPAGVSCRIIFTVPSDAVVKGNSPFLPGPEPGMPDFKPGDTGLWVMDEDSVATFNGAPIQNPWVRLLADADSSVDRLELDAPVDDWPAGGEVLITPWDNPGACEIRRIVAGQGSRLTLESPPAYFHPGRRYAYHKTTKALRLLGAAESPSTNEVLVRNQCEVALLTRNLTIASDMAAGKGKAHTVAMMGGTYSAGYAELKDMGPKPPKGRYPLHLHRIGEAQAAFFVGNAVWNTSAPGHQGIVLHDTNGVLVDNNLVYNVQGPPIDTERATEKKNIFRRNLLVKSAAPDPTPQDDLAARFSYIAGTSAGIWVRPDNAFQDNVIVAGINGTIGLAITPSSASAFSAPPVISGNTVRGCFTGIAFFGNASAEFRDGLLAANAQWATASPGEYEGLRNSILADNRDMGGDQPSDDAEAKRRQPDLTPIGNVYLNLPRILPCGDLNGDNRVDIVDLRLLVTWILDDAAAPARGTPPFCRADVTNDGILNLADALRIVHRIVRDAELTCCGG